MFRVLLFKGRGAVLAFLATLLATPGMLAQDAASAVALTPEQGRWKLVRPQDQPAPATAVVASEKYVLGAGDSISVQARDAEELTGLQFRIDEDGQIRLPMVGLIEAADKTLHEVELELERKLAKYYVDPQVRITVTEYRSRPVSVLGAVRNPGVISLQGQTTLLQALLAAGDRREDAGSYAIVSRRLSEGRLPLPDARVDPTGEYHVARVDISGLYSGENPAANFVVEAHDVISVEKAEIVYVMGKVNRAGGFVLEGDQEISVLTAIAMAEGWNPEASPSNAVILRPSATTSRRREISVNLKKVMKGEEEDLLLQPEDILFIPSSKSKKVIQTLATSSIALVTSVAVWRLGR
jgi:polysaccharide export outer membrane protein